VLTTHVFDNVLKSERVIECCASDLGMSFVL